MEAVFLIIAGEKRKVAERLLGHPGITDARTVYGAYDIIAFTGVEDPARLQGILKEKIPEIQLITTLVAETGDEERHVRKMLLN